MENLIQKTCSNCGSMKFKTWNQLTDDEKSVVERIASVSDEKKELQRFCKRCFYSSNDNTAKYV